MMPLRHAFDYFDTRYMLARHYYAPAAPHAAGAFLLLHCYMLECRQPVH